MPTGAHRAIVLLSGGLDSATTLAIARADGCECHCLSFSYGQRHRVEIDAARLVAASLKAASHRIIEIDLAAFGGSALTDPAIPVPKSHSPSVPVPDPRSPVPLTYVPARNTIFLSYALAAAEVIDARRVYIGVNAIDYSGYPDCRPEFIEAFQRMADVATRAGVERCGPKLVAPLINLTKAQIIRRGLDLGVDYSLTVSCYDPSVRAGRIIPCGHCDSCRFRAAAFAELLVKDPALAQA